MIVTVMVALAETELAKKNASPTASANGEHTASGGD
jgi:hypothetical protein